MKINIKKHDPMLRWVVCPFPDGIHISICCDTNIHDGEIMSTSKSDLIDICIIDGEINEAINFIMDAKKALIVVGEI